MAQSREVKIEGLPDFVTVEHGTKGYKTTLYADVHVENSGVTTKELGEAILKLAELGFKFEGVTYDLGYYDSIDDKRLQFIKYGEKESK